MPTLPRPGVVQNGRKREAKPRFEQNARGAGDWFGSGQAGNFHPPPRRTCMSIKENGPNPGIGGFASVNTGLFTPPGEAQGWRPELPQTLRRCSSECQVLPLETGGTGKVGGLDASQTLRPPREFCPKRDLLRNQPTFAPGGGQRLPGASRPNQSPSFFLGRQLVGTRSFLHPVAAGSQGRPRAVLGVTRPRHHPGRRSAPLPAVESAQ
jgi:hypothetical protein